jgi:putative DNA primase/helicase
MPTYGRPWTHLGRKVAASLGRGMQHPRDLKLAAGAPRVILPLPTRPEKNVVEASTTADALAVWNASVGPRGTPVEGYLRSRALPLDGDVAGSVIRWHPRRNALVALFRNILSDAPQALTRVFLSYAATPLKQGRAFLGPVSGAAIKLDADAAISVGLFLGEGLETCLAARAFGLRPCWAAGSTGAIRTFPVLTGVETITLLQENDAASPPAVAACAARWQEAGRRALINTPHLGKDLNDALIARRGRGHE